jgi:hypothetical protein
VAVSRSFYSVVQAVRPCLIEQPRADAAIAPRQPAPGQRPPSRGKNGTRRYSAARETNLGKVLHWLTKRFGVGFRKVRNNGGPCSLFNQAGRLLAKAFAVGVYDRLHADERRFRAAVEHSTASLIGIRRAPHLPGTSSKRPGIV